MKSACGLRWLAALSAILSLPLFAQAPPRDGIEPATQGELAEIRRAFQSVGLKGADIARGPDGRAILVGEYENRDEVETAFSAARAVLGLRRVAPTTPSNIKYRLKGFDTAFASTVAKMMKKPAASNGDKPAVAPATPAAQPAPPAAQPAPPRTESRRAPRTYALVMGIGKFKNLPEKNYLEFSAKDATDFYSTLTSSSGGKVSKEYATLLRDQEANSQAVHAQMRKLIDVTEAGDTVVIFAASHGLPNATGKFDVVLHDTEFPKKKAGASKSDSLDMAVTNRATTLSDEDMGQFIVQMVLKDVRTVLVLDTCYSGKTFVAVPGFLPSRTRSLTRYNQEVEYKTAPSQESIAELAAKAKDAKATRIVIVSASENEESLEMPEIGGGMFTQLYLGQLKSDRDYADAFDQTKPQVIKKARTVGFSQTPRMLVVPEEAQTRM